MKEEIRTYAFVLLGLGILILFHLYSFSGMKGYDGIEYAYHATQVSQGNLSLGDHHFAHRFTVVFLAALSYSILGVGDLASALPAAIASILMILLLVLSCKKYPWQVILMALLFAVLSPNFLYYWDKLMPDIQVALGAMMAFWARSKYEEDGNARWGMMLAAGLSWAFFSKATVVLLIPILIFFMLKDRRNRQAIYFWAWALGLGLLVLLLYLGTMYLLTDNPFLRFERIMAKGYLNTCSYDQLEIKYLWKRIGYELIHIWAQNGTLLALLPILPASLFCWSKFDSSARFWSGTSIAGLLSANFMTISPTAYIPMCADERHFLFLMLPWAIASGLLLPTLYQDRRSSILALLLAISLIFWTKGVVQWAYGLAALSFAIAVLNDRLGKLKFLKYIPLFISLFVVPINYAIYLKSLHYQAHKKSLLEWMKQQEGATLVVTNAVQERIGNYYHGFDSTYHIQFREFGELEPSWSESHPNTFLLSNAYARFMSGMEWDDLPAYAREIPSLLKPDIQLGHIELYSLPDISWVLMPDPFWEDSVVYGTPISDGENLVKAERVVPKSFSSGWEMEFAKIPYNKGRLWIHSQLIIRNMDKGESNWQIHVDTPDGQNLQWKSASLKHRTPTPGKWASLRIDHLVDISSDSSQLLKIRLWNEGPSEVQIAKLQVKMAWLPPKKEQP